MALAHPQIQARSAECAQRESGQCAAERTWVVAFNARVVGGLKRQLLLSRTQLGGLRSRLRLRGLACLRGCRHSCGVRARVCASAVCGGGAAPVSMCRCLGGAFDQDSPRAWAA